MAKRKKNKFLKKVLLFSFIFAMVLFGGLFLWVSTFSIPNLDSFEERKITQSTKIYDRTGEILLYDVFENIKRTVVPIDQISQHLKDAIIAIEDKNFYSHNGISISGIIRGQVMPRLQGKRTQGGSTITQQFVKNAILTDERAVERKIKEWVLSLRLEQKLSKEEILALYLNEIPYGGSIYGAEEASKLFFGKTAEDLTLAESAYLAALPKAPTYFSPYGQNKDKLEERKDIVLENMLELGFINQSEYDEAKKEEVVFLPQQDQGIKAPHFVIYVRELLAEKYGQNVIENGGLKVITTLDYELQTSAEEIVKETALTNSEKFNATNAASVVIKTDTGEILSMVGSRDYFDKEIDGNFNIATANRQPGSVFKPFAYAEAFNKGYRPETVIFDLETEFSTVCASGGECYNPSNYDDIFRGPVSMRDALAQSINIPAIKTLYLAGMQDTLHLAKNMGIQSLTNINQYGLTLVLGGGEVSLLDVTGAYGVFANEGQKVNPTPFLEIKNNQEETIFKLEPQQTKVLEPNTANQISDVLSDNTAREPAFGSRSALYFENDDVAAKTGTTNDYRDAWTVGYSTKIAVGAWAGNNDNTPMEKKVAGFIVTPMWNQVMSKSLELYPGSFFNKPSAPEDLTIKPIIRGFWEGGESTLIDKVSGGLATDLTPKETLGEIVTGGIHSILHWVDKNDPLGPVPTKPEQDPQFNLWEEPVREWVSSNNLNEPNRQNIPSDYDNVHTAQNAPKVLIRDPKNDATYKKDQKVDINLNVHSRYETSKIEYFINDTYIGSSNTLNFSFVPEDIKSIKKENVLKVRVTDSVFNKTDSEVKFSVNL